MFGTDGIRGKVNVFPMVPDIALRFGMAAGVYLKKASGMGPESRPNVVIAKDTRLSGYLLESALTSGLVSLGIDVVLVGPMPTPAVSKLVRSLRATFGIMITASHNPYHDNGFKLFNKEGHKLTQDCEQAIYGLIEQNDFTSELSNPSKLGRVTRLDDAPGRYIEHVKSALPRDLSLQGLRIVIDCANGSAYRIGPTVLWELGAEVIAIHNEPDGININDNCGSIHPQSLSNRVLETRADIGLALDGDADRLAVCDENGDMIDGDHIIAAIALNLCKQKKVNAKNGVVVTEASNSALSEYLRKSGLHVAETKVGDRNVALAMQQNSSKLGGEKSGHVIVHEYGLVSDGLIAALHVLSHMKVEDQPASTLNKMFQLYPQYAGDIHYYGDNPLEHETIKQQLQQLVTSNPQHRILVRKSGTERLIRVMVEGQNLHETTSLGENIQKILVDGIAVKFS